jgi:flagellar assembly protein FliH
LSRFTHHNIHIGETLELSGASDRQEQIERTLERLKKERIKQAELECQRIIDQARQEAGEIIQLARQKAQALVEEGENSRDEILRQGYQEGETAGYRKGYTDGHQQAEDETTHLLQSARTMMEGAYEARRKVLDGFRHQAGGLVSHIARKVLHKELAESPEIVVAMIERAVEALHLNGKIKIVIGAETLNLLRTYSETTAAALAKLKRFDLEIDPLLEINQVYVLSEEGNFILSPDAQMDQLLEPLEKHLELPETTPDELNGDIPDLSAPDEALLEDAPPGEPSGEEN